MSTSEILIYQNQNGHIKIDVRLEDETVWLTQGQLCELFQKSKATISEHIKNVFEEGELDAEATVRKFRIVQQEGSRHVERELEHYNLDVIISVGYRVKSPQGTQFRIGATYRRDARPCVSTIRHHPAFCALPHFSYALNSTPYATP